MKKNLRKSIALGICSAAIISQHHAAFAGSTAETIQLKDMQMSEKELAFEHKLTDHAIETFIQMNHEQRSMAMQIANHACSGKNNCKGQGNCKSDKNSCKGQNACKGQGSCKVAAEDAVMMAKKRTQFNAKDLK